ncbi:MAG TPA: hypothetical protein VE487_06045 [Ilumatobacter sp.]|jgi:hypothetical protein|nr:hypothetical protein [Ilumatobacter sp.]
MSHEPPHHPHASVLRQRAATLRDLAGSLERSIVTTLDELTGADTWSTPRARLCEAMLARNLHQLHRAADDLRDTAFRMQARAGELEHSLRARGAA